VSRIEQTDGRAACAAVLLAAGQGTRMRSALPKVLHHAAGVPLIGHALAALNGMTEPPAPVVVVLGHQAERVRSELPGGLLVAVQEPQRGTADAVKHARAQAAGGAPNVLIAYADVPLVASSTLDALLALHTEKAATGTLLTMDLSDPALYGRIVRTAGGGVRAIVEAGEADGAELAIREVNTGFSVWRDEWLWDALERLQPHAGGETYFTDLVGLAVEDGLAVEALTAADPLEGLGVNTRADLALAEQILRNRIRRRHLEAGVTMISPETTWIDEDVRIGRDTVIWPGTYVTAGTTVGEGCELGPDSLIRASRVGSGARVTYSLVDSSEVGAGCSVGPFAYLRAGVRMAAGSRAGAHAEIKNSTLAEGARVPHFSYVGDATVGPGVNVGAGTTFANYDGVAKHRTEVGEGVFLGSGTVLVAPVRVGPGARTGAGSVVIDDVPAGVTVVGVPARPIRARQSRPDAEDAEGQ
jgi:bifunctional UDP-N-acetylglucosamine pyrophosphorylase/glucosamine-1-phosphate N-acetyltransferase